MGQKRSAGPRSPPTSRAKLATAPRLLRQGLDNSQNALSVRRWLQDELSLRNRQPWGPQRPEERFSHNPADQGKGRQDEAKMAIEHNAMLTGHAPSRSLGLNQDRRILVADCGDNTAQVWSAARVLVKR
jgi:hypothetical protein